MMDENLNITKNEIGWTSGGINGTYAVKNNSLRLTSGLDYMTNGNNDDSVQILGFKIGADLISIKSDKNYHADIGSKVMANISPNLCLLFDSETGQMLEN